MNYDDAVRLANRMAEEHGWISDPGHSLAGL